MHSVQVACLDKLLFSQTATSRFLVLRVSFILKLRQDRFCPTPYLAFRCSCRHFADFIQPRDRRSFSDSQVFRVGQQVCQPVNFFSLPTQCFRQHFCFLPSISDFRRQASDDPGRLFVMRSTIIFDPSGQDRIEILSYRNIWACVCSFNVSANVRSEFFRRSHCHRIHPGCQKNQRGR